MSASTTVTPSSTSAYTTPAFWERLWRMSGINFVVFLIIAYVIYGYQPQVGAPADALVAFYDGHRTRILIAAVFAGFAVRLAHHRPRVGPGREPGPLEPKPRYALGMVMPTLLRVSRRKIVAA